MEFKEVDMYLPVKEYFDALGYKINSEVMSCDMTAQKDETLIVVEFKKQFNTKLLFQAIDRQRFADLVYMAILKPEKIGKDFTKIKHIADKMNLGLIIVSLNSSVKYINIIHEPQVPTKLKNSRKKAKIKGETDARSLDINLAGSSKEKIATAYREKCIQVAAIIYYEKEVSIKLLVDKYSLDKKTNSILQKNFYNWFKRKENGVYQLTDACFGEIQSGKFTRLFDLYLDKYKT